MTTSLMNKFEQLLAEVPPAMPKQAFEAVGGGEPEGQGATGSDTTSATKSVPNASNPEAAKDGTFAQTLSKEVKEMGPGSIDGLPDATPTDPNSIQGCVGLKQTTVGNAPEQEDDFVGSLKEPGVGTSTNAKFDDGKKYASVQEFMQKSSTDRSAYLTNLANSLLADIATAANPGTKTAAAAPADGSAQPAGTPDGAAKTAAEAPKADALIGEMEAGYQLAKVLGMEKMSADQRAAATIGATIQDALFDAECVVGWLQKCASEMPADDGSKPKEPEPKKPDADASAPSDGGGDASGGAPADKGGSDPIGSAMSQFQDPSGGGDPSGGDPSGGQGGLDGGGQVSRDELLQGLLIAMQELGITPQDVMQASAGGAGGAPDGGAGGMPGGMPGAGGPPPVGGDPTGGMGAPKMASTVHKMAKAAQEFQRSGKFVWAPPTTKRARQIADRAKSMLMELKVS